VAYSITGSITEAEDCVQEAWLRLQRADVSTVVRDLRSWLTTTVARLALDARGSARSRREQYVGTWLPEPLVEHDDVPDAGERVLFAESLTLALLVVLERLSAAERTAFLLHDIFGLTFEEVAKLVDRSPGAVRQLASRAREHIEHERPRFPPTQEEQRKLVNAFAAACQDGDLHQLIALLDPDVVCRGDGGKMGAAVDVLQGAEQVARALLAVVQGPPRTLRVVQVNGAPGLVLRDAGGVLNVVAFTANADRIATIDVIRNPDKLTHVRGLGAHPDSHDELGLADGTVGGGKAP
jgi:RNA polymerase sigma-70 factor, ECF subfamily